MLFGETFPAICSENEPILEVLCCCYEYDPVCNHFAPEPERGYSVTQSLALNEKPDNVGLGRAFCSEIGSSCLKNKSGIFVNGIIYDNETKERTFLFLMVLM